MTTFPFKHKTLSFFLSLLAVVFASASSVTGQVALGCIDRGSIVVDTQGTRLAFTDSGPPSSSYITVFAVNGLGFNGNIFNVLQSAAPASGYRVVAINRRGYGGSTNFTQTEMNIIFNGTESERDAFWRDLGVQFLTFMDVFMQENDIPPISDDRKTGGAALVGWSFGNIITLSAVAHIDTIPEDVRERLAARLRTLVMQEPSADALGMHAAPRNWVPQIDPLIPADVSGAFFAQWVTSYFTHGDLSTRDPNVLQYVLPAFDLTPTIWVKADEVDPSLQTDGIATLDIDILGMAAQLEASYVGANFNETIRGMLPNMKKWFIAGERTASFALYAFWVVQDNNTDAGGGFVDFQLVPGNINHFVHVDDPKTTLEVYHEIIDV